MRDLPDTEAAIAPVTAGTAPDTLSVAVILPCYNEQIAIGEDES